MKYYRYAAAIVLALGIILVGGIYSFADTTRPVVATIATTPETSTVKLFDASGSGSGVHIGGGHIVTAAHVIGDSKSVSMKTEAGATSTAEILWSNKAYDIALLHTDTAIAGASKLDCREPAFGEQIQAAGNPLDIEFVSSFGRVAGKARKTGPWESVVITDITTVMGQSGGGVFANDGRVVGINVGVSVAPLKMKDAAGAETYTPTMTGFGFVVPASAVCLLLGRDA